MNDFDNKFHYNHWRPYTAIRWAENDGNPNTVADTSWDNLYKHTYAFPSSPSAQRFASSAAMTDLTDWKPRTITISPRQRMSLVKQVPFLNQ